MLQFGVRVPNDDDPIPYCSYIPTQGSRMESRDPITRTGSSHYRTACNIVHAATPCHRSIFSKHWTVDDLPALLPRMTLRYLTVISIAIKGATHVGRVWCGHIVAP